MSRVVKSAMTGLSVCVSPLIDSMLVDIRDEERRRQSTLFKDEDCGSRLSEVHLALPLISYAIMKFLVVSVFVCFICRMGIKDCIE